MPPLILEDCNEDYKFIAVPSYSHSISASAYPPNGFQHLPPPPGYAALPGLVNRYYDPAPLAAIAVGPILPPMQVPDRPTTREEMMMLDPRWQQEQRRRQQLQLIQALQHPLPSVAPVPPMEEKVVGGVSATLDYDMERMTDFVSEMAQGMYALLTSPICLADIDLLRSVQPGHEVAPQFRRWVEQILCATRLPCATILLGLHYLSVRMTMLSDGRFKREEGQLYRLLTIALVLGSKFLDDNTFINRSWAEVSGIDVAQINQLEKNWLIDIRFDLHHHPTRQQGFDAWRAHWKRFDAHAANPHAGPAERAPLAPLDTTNIPRQGSVHSETFSAQSFDHMQHMAALRELDMKLQRAQQNIQETYACFGACPGNRPPIQSSPITAPHSDPATPEYFGGPSAWAPEGYSRRTMFGFPPVSQAPAHPAATLPAAFTHDPRQATWTGHGPNCLCAYCQPMVADYMFSGYNMQAVIG